MTSWTKNLQKLVDDETLSREERVKEANEIANHIANLENELALINKQLKFLRSEYDKIRKDR